MKFGRGTIGHGHWRGKQGHRERDIGACQGQWIGTLGHRDWERDTKSWTLEIGRGTLNHGHWKGDTRTWTLVIEIEREQTT